MSSFKKVTVWWTTQTQNCTNTASYSMYIGYYESTARSLESPIEGETAELNLVVSQAEKKTRSF